MAALAVLAWAFRRHPAGTRARTQLAVLLLVSFLPLGANLLYVTRSIETGLNPTVGAFGVALAVSLAGLERLGLFGVSGLTLEHWLDHESDGVAIVDAEGRLLRTNPAAARLLGVSDLALDTDVAALLGERLTLPESSEPVGRGTLWTLLGAGTPPGGSLFRLTAAPRRWLRIRTTAVPARWPSQSGLAELSR